MIFRALSLAVTQSRSFIFWRTFFPQPQPQLQLAGMSMPTTAAAALPVAASTSTTSTIWQDLAIWLMAVPKQKVSRHKKRLKTTLQNRIKLRSDIVIDGRTGETTLRHKMPLNWKDYLPKEI